MRTLARVQQVAGPSLIVALVALAGTQFDRSTQIYFVNGIVAVAIVVALYTFVGNSGVLSFGHISFVALGAWTAGVLSIPSDVKPAILPNLFGFLQHTSVSNVASLAIAAAVGGIAALLVGLPLMRLSGLAAGIATFGVLEIFHNVLRYWEKLGPGAGAFSSVPETTGLLQAALGAIVAIVVAFGYQSHRRGRLLRATREDAAAAQAVGVSVFRERLVAFALSGALAGLAGGLFIHQLVITSEDVYLDLTFMTLAMLVIGGSGSLFGAVIGALAVSALDSFLAQSENGAVGFMPDLPSGTRLVAVGALMAVVLVLRPAGITGGREFALGRRRGVR